jgi:hypothetical protein
MVWRFRQSSTDLLGAVLATDIDFVDAVPTATQCAAIIMGRINTTSPALTGVRAYTSLGNALVVLVNMRLGSAGNTVMATTQAGFVLANPTGTETSINRAGFGAPLNTFRINFRWSSTAAALVGNTFIIERGNVILNLGAADGGAEWSGDGGILGMRGIRAVNNSATPGAFFMILLKMRLECEGVEIDGRGNGSLTVASHAEIGAMGLFPFAADFWANQVPNPFGGLDVSNGNGIFVHDLSGGVVMGGGGGQGLFNCWTVRSCNIAMNGKQGFLGLTAADFWRSVVTCGSGHVNYNTGSANYFGRMKEQLTLSSAQGLINLNNNGGNASANIAQMELLGSAGDAIRADQGATPLIATHIGHGNWGAGLRSLSGSMHRTGATVTVTGMGGDIKSGNRAARTYASYAATPPIGNETDPNDGSAVRTATPQNYTETRTGSATAAAFADIQFSSYMNGAPAIPALNTDGDATATSVARAVWQGAGLLRVFFNAASTGTVSVSATATFAQT